MKNLERTTMETMAIRDGKYLTLPHASAWQRSPIKIENLDFFFVGVYKKILDTFYVYVFVM